MDEEYELEGMDPAMIEYLLGAYGDQLKTKRGEDQLAQSRALRDRGMQPLEGRDAGGTFVANNPLEFLGQAGLTYRGLKDEKKAKAGLEGLDAAQGKRALDFGKGLFKRRTPGIVPDGDADDNPFGYDGGY
jgi:hypothetical protein